MSQAHGGGQAGPVVIVGDVVMDQVHAAGGRPAVGSGSAAEVESLGIYTELRNAPQNDEIEGQSFEQMSRSRAYTLKARAAELLPHERVRICMNHRVEKVEMVNLNIVGDEGEPGRSYFSNLMVCKSVWVCPVCARNEAEKRRIELQEALDIWHMSGGTVLHLINTLQHHKYESCEVVLSGLQDAMRRLWNGRRMKRLIEEYGIEGRVYGPEVTWGFENGFHPHRHTTLFVKGSLSDAQIEALEREMSICWEEVLGRIGRYASLEHGLKLVRGDAEGDYLADYFNKFGYPPNDPDLVKRWTVANEATKSHLKLTRGETFTPMDLLAIYDETEEEEVGQLFVEYATAFKGKKQLVWSRGLRDRIAELKAELGIESEPEPEPEPVWTAAQFPDEPWAEIRKRQLQPKLQNLAEMGADLAIKAFLDGEGIKGVYYPRLDIKAELNPLEDGEGVVIDLYEYVWGEVRGGDLAGDLGRGDLAGEAAQVQWSLFNVYSSEL